MANKYRGEIDASLDGKPYTLCLTLGALAELESAFGTEDMLALASRFTQGRISASDCVRIIGAGLRGGGHDVANDVVATMRGDNGAAGFVDVVARLLAATFGGPAGGVIANVALDAIEGAIEGAAVTMAKAEAPQPFLKSPHQSPAAPAPFPGPR